MITPQSLSSLYYNEEQDKYEVGICIQYRFGAHSQVIEIMIYSVMVKLQRRR